MNASFNIMSAQPLSELKQTPNGNEYQESNKQFRLMCSCNHCRNPQIFDIEYIREFVRDNNKIMRYCPTGSEISAFLNRLTPEIIYKSYASPNYSTAMAIKEHKWGQIINDRIRITARYPDSTLQSPSDLPPPIQTEFTRLYSTSDPMLQVLQCRRILETACKTYLGEQFTPNTNLNSLIYQILQSEKLTHSLKDWVHHIRILGNTAAHYDETDYTPEQAKDLCSFIILFLELLYSYPAKVDTMRQPG